MKNNWESVHVNDIGEGKAWRSVTKQVMDAIDARVIYRVRGGRIAECAPDVRALMISEMEAEDAPGSSIFGTVEADHEFIADLPYPPKVHCSSCGLSQRAGRLAHEINANTERGW